LSEWSGAKIS